MAIPLILSILAGFLILAAVNLQIFFLSIRYGLSIAISAFLMVLFSFTIIESLIEGVQKDFNSVTAVFGLFIITGVVSMFGILVASPIILFSFLIIILTYRNKPRHNLVFWLAIFVPMSFAEGLILYLIAYNYYLCKVFISNYI